MISPTPVVRLEPSAVRVKLKNGTAFSLITSAAAPIRDALTGPVTVVSGVRSGRVRCTAAAESTVEESHNSGYEYEREGERRDGVESDVQ